MTPSERTGETEVQRGAPGDEHCVIHERDGACGRHCVNTCRRRPGDLQKVQGELAGSILVTLSLSVSAARSP